MKLTDNELKSINGGTDDGYPRVTYRVANHNGTDIREKPSYSSSAIPPKIPFNFELRLVSEKKEHGWIHIPAQCGFPAGYVLCKDLKKM